jgi:hypothetical protein
MPPPAEGASTGHRQRSQHPGTGKRGLDVTAGVPLSSDSRSGNSVSVIISESVA